MELVKNILTSADLFDQYFEKFRGKRKNTNQIKYCDDNKSL